MSASGPGTRIQSSCAFLAFRADNFGFGMGSNLSFARTNIEPHVSPSSAGCNLLSATWQLAALTKRDLRCTKGLEFKAQKGELPNTTSVR